MSGPVNWKVNEAFRDVRVHIMVYIGWRDWTYSFNMKYSYIGIFYKPTSTKPQAGKLGYTYKIMVVMAITLLPWCCGKKLHFLFAEPRKGVGKECCLPVVFRDSGDACHSLV